MNWAGPSGLKSSPRPDPSLNGLGPGFSQSGGAGPKADLGPRAFWRPLVMTMVNDTSFETDIAVRLPVMLDAVQDGGTCYSGIGRGDQISVPFC